MGLYQVVEALALMLLLIYMYWTLDGCSINTWSGVGKFVVGVIPASVITMIVLMVVSAILHELTGSLVDWANYEAHCIFDALQWLEDVFDPDEHQLIRAVLATVLGSGVFLILVGWIWPADLTVTSWLTPFLWTGTIILVPFLSHLLKTALFKQVKTFSVCYTGAVPPALADMLRVLFDINHANVPTKDHRHVHLGVARLPEGTGFEVTCVNDIELLEKLPERFNSLIKGTPVEK